MRNLEQKTEIEDQERINKYLESKLDLCADWKEDFDEIPTLKTILASHMRLYEASENKEQLKSKTRDELIAAGVIDSVEVLEFLLLISEKERDFSDQPDPETPDEEIAEYFFEKYKSPEEKWIPRSLPYYKKHSASQQTTRDRFLEEVAIEMIIGSRVSYEEAIKPTPEKIVETIDVIDDYFKQAFKSVFGVEPPLSLSKVTHVTDKLGEWADLIGGRTFINIKNHKDRDKFAHFVMHEGLHLCLPARSPGFHSPEIEEGVIEYCIEKMFKTIPSENFNYDPASKGYQKFKDGVKSLFETISEAEKQFTEYFLTGEIEQFNDFLKSKVTDKIKKKTGFNYQ
ncbi:MAG: hypothetical protein NTY81_03060 [Candidatus Staskawiczbacteria bacterium]|nr:hypothetical protein [Candidatus Staskawiczbacteria bacterium]